MSDSAPCASADAERRVEAIQRDVELAVVAVRAGDAPKDRRRGSALAEKTQRAVVLNPRELAIAGALGRLGLGDEVRRRAAEGQGKRAVRSAHATDAREGAGGRVIFFASVGREMPSKRAAAA